MKVFPWWASAVAIGFAAALAGCSSTAHTAASAASPAAHATVSSSASPASASSAQASPAATSVPVGYQRVGGPAQGVSFAVPASWVVVNLAKQTEEQAAKKFSLQGVSAAEVVQDVQSLQKQHGLIVFDVKSRLASSSHFATTINAYCTSSGTTETGSESLALLRPEALAGLQELHAGHISAQDTAVGNVPGLQISYTLSTGDGTLDGAQLEVLPKPDRACFLTLTALKGQFPGSVMPVVAASAVYP